MKNYIYKLAISKAIFHHLSKYVKWNASKQSSNIFNGNNIHLEKYDIRPCEKQITKSMYSVYFLFSFIKFYTYSNKYIKYWWVIFFKKWKNKFHFFKCFEILPHISHTWKLHNLHPNIHYFMTNKTRVWKELRLRRKK